MYFEQKFRSLVRYFRQRWRLVLLYLFRLIHRLFRLNRKLVLGYSPLQRFDGLGAQLQRVIALNGLARYWKTGIHHEPILKIATHPIDGFQTRREYEKFLKYVNDLVGAQSIITQEYRAVYQIRILKPGNLINILLKVILRQGKVLVQISEPYYFVDAYPDIYKLGVDDELIERLNSHINLSLSGQVVLHHRHGVGNMVIQPGQNSPRELELARYFKPIKEANIQGDENLIIFTDAPETGTIFAPPVDQKDAWTGLPGFDGKQLSVSSQSFEVLKDTFDAKISIIRGGNPLNAIANMSTASKLILSRSSFGFVAALLSKETQVWIPTDFWHTGLSNWNRY